MIFSPLAGTKGTHYRITQKFGENPAYYAKYGHKGHNGIDFAPPKPGQKGVIVYAPHTGYVKLGNNGGVGYGKYVQITSLPYRKDGVGQQSVLAHLETQFIPDGQIVYAGDPIGIMGNTGDSSNVHCHWTFKKVDALGNVLDTDNGYNGAIDIARYAQQWDLNKTLS